MIILHRSLKISGRQQYGSTAAKHCGAIRDDASLPQNLAASQLNTEEATNEANGLVTGFHPIIAKEGIIGDDSHRYCYHIQSESSHYKDPKRRGNAKVLADEPSALTPNVKADIKIAKAS